MIYYISIVCGNHYKYVCGYVEQYCTIFFDYLWNSDYPKMAQIAISDELKYIWGACLRLH